MDVLLTPEQVAEKLQVTKVFVYQLKTAGKLKSISIGKKCLRFRECDVEEFINSQLNTN